jgi:A nuclease family of the HNH/ENDO VII superfamily with conserved AHH
MLRFRSVNQRASVGYRNGWQRHHLIPQQIEGQGEAGNVIASIVRFGFSLDDFARNGMLLPGSEPVASASGLPVHAGPHPNYNRRVARLVAGIGEQTQHPVRRFAQILLLQRDLRRTLSQDVTSLVSVDLIDLSIDCEAHRRLDAEVEAILARFALGEDIA